jgi:predicted nucleic-acid-binding protein
VENLRFRNSKSDVLIQLADMIVGAINRSYDATKTDHQDYIKLIKSRIDDIWEFQ